MAEVVAPRVALSAISVNTAQNAALSSNRLSMGAKRSVGRPSMSGRRSSLHSSAVNAASAGRPSLSASTSGASAASGRRSSTHSRPSSVLGASALSSSVRSDPRPLHDKGYVKEQIHKIILYCMAHAYDRPLSPKLLLSPSSRDFRHLMSFLLQRIDPNFAFSAQPEDDIKRVMKALGYPFPLSKNALQAAGTPHTWPALLLMMAWMVDFLLYDEKVEAADEGAAANTEPHPEKMFFAYLTRSYAAFIQGDDQAAAALEEELANTFAVRHASAAEEIARLDARRSCLLGELSAQQAAASTCAALTRKRAEYTSDVAKFERLISDVTAHLAAVNDKLRERQAEAADRKEHEDRLRAEQQQIAATLAAQEFTPLQIQSMMHQQQMMQEALAELEQQKGRLQGERWEVERVLDKRMGELSALVSEFNALGVSIEILPAGARHSGGAELQLSMVADAAAVLAEDSAISAPEHVLSPDLKAAVKPVLQALQATLSARVAQLTASGRVCHEEWVALTEARAERQRCVQALQAALAKREEALKAGRAEMNEQLRALVEQVEAVEAQVSEERGRRAREEREQAEKALADAEAERARRETEWRAEKAREQQHMWALIEELVNHAERIHAALAHIAQQAAHVRQHVQASGHAVGGL